MATLVCYGGTYIHTESCIDYYNHHGDNYEVYTVFGTFMLYMSTRMCCDDLLHIHYSVTYIHFLVTN